MGKRLFVVMPFILAIFVFGCAPNISSPSNIPSQLNIQAQVVGGSGGKVGINQGDIAPDFTIRTIEGKTISLSQLTKDKPTVLYFFATWCPNCARDLSAVKDIYPQYSDKVNFLAIDIDIKESSYIISQYKQRMDLDGVVFAPGDRNVLRKYGVSYTTTKFFLGKGGVILNKGIGSINKNTWNQIFQQLSQ